MSSDIPTHRNRWIAGLLILAIVLLLAVVSIVLFLQNRNEGPGPRVGSRSPIAELAYCAGEDRELCIISFSQIVDGGMQVNIQTPRVFYPRILLVINRYGVESTYECRKVEPLANRVVCEGPPQVPGEILQFKVLLKEQGTLVAEGKFSIIGIAISTPEVIPTATVTATATTTPTVTPTGAPIRRTPTPAGTTPSPSYPNPSYP
jgi:hypothetical protein